MVFAYVSLQVDSDESVAYYQLSDFYGADRHADLTK